jgi:hypothetical protein
MADDDGLFELKLAAEKGEIIGEELHGVVLMRLVALPVTAKIDGDDAMSLPREMLDCGAMKECSQHQP